ncbi:MAG: hypothetical protein KC441_08760 [Anaerolineales bacterium]|nr:hypothetical protein [Anaerolineales bacterium]
MNLPDVVVWTLRCLKNLREVWFSFMVGAAGEVSPENGIEILELAQIGPLNDESLPVFIAVGELLLTETPEISWPHLALCAACSC